MSYQLLFSETSRNQIRHLHPELKSTIRARLKSLANNPYAGKQLERELSGYFSTRVRRFRIVYKIAEKDQIIEIHYIGHRKDIYELFQQQLGRGR